MHKNLFSTFLLSLFCLIVLGLSLRGAEGNPTDSSINQAHWKNNGPFELSPERGRFALTYSLVEDKSFQFSDNIGKFASPDVAVHNGKFVSLFAPLLSFLTIPGYVFGKYFGISQVGTFATISFFAILNVILIKLISIRLGANRITAAIASAVFLFATPAFAYAVNLYQHHASTFLILLSIYALLKSKKAWPLVVVFFSCAAAISLDYPNLFFMFPLGAYAISRIISIGKLKKNFFVKINLFKAFTPFVMIIPILFFLWFNHVSYGNFFQLSGTLQTEKNLDKPEDLPSFSTLQTREKEKAIAKKTAVGFFNARNILNGFYVHFVSSGRGLIYYTPVILFGIAGMILAIKKKVAMMPLLSGIIGANILLYSMWGDPWGGWAFGSRYLIPSYAILSIFIALFLTYWNKKILLLIVFLIATFYSIAVNALGAITTSAIPPQPEVLNLEKISGAVQKYTYVRNWDFLLSGNTKSFIYETFLNNYLSSVAFYLILTVSICFFVGAIIIYYYLNLHRKGEENV